MAGPMEEMLSAGRDRLSMHMPGHKGRYPEAWLTPWSDTTELPDTDDLFAPAGAIAEAQRLAAQSAGAGTAQMLTGGATSGILAMLLYALRPGDRVILPRNAHVSMISGCVLAGAEPVYVWPQTADEGLWWIRREDVLAAIEANPDARAVLVTRPDYYGLCLELSEIAQACRDRGMLLLVDEAHGAHLNGCPFGPGSAAGGGADLWVQSAHKTLPALTGAAWLFAREAIAPQLRRALRWVHSSSPSFLILRSLDEARAWMDREGPAALCALQARIREFWRRMEDIPGLRNGHLGAPQPVDTLRLVVDVSRRGRTGHQALAFLRERGIDAEMADARRVVLIPTVFDRPEDLTYVAQALAELPQGESLPGPEADQLSFRPEVAMLLRQAALCAPVARPLADCAGAVAAAPVGLYPPGIPLWMPGERIDGEALAFFRERLGQGAAAFGLMEGRMPCVE